MTTLKCTTCKKKFERIQVRDNKYGQFCSRACFGKFKSKTLVGELASNTKLRSLKIINKLIEPVGYRAGEWKGKWIIGTLKRTRRAVKSAFSRAV